MNVLKSVGVYTNSFKQAFVLSDATQQRIEKAYSLVPNVSDVRVFSAVKEKRICKGEDEEVYGYFQCSLPAWNDIEEGF